MFDFYFKIRLFIELLFFLINARIFGLNIIEKYGVCIKNKSFS